VSDLREVASRLLDVPLGGTAVGTGLGAPEGFTESAVAYLRSESGVAARPASNRIAAIASLEPLAAIADSMARAARVLARIAADFRLLAAGPAGGFGELLLPPLQPGSSIMPGKVNPVLPELVMQVSFDLAGSAHTIALATAAGELQIALMGPIAADKLLTGSVQLARVSELFAKRCIAGMEWDRERVRRNLEQGSFEPAVQAVSEVGYEQAASQQSRRREPKKTSEG
jgi:aspartate ammonia-lyase